MAGIVIAGQPQQVVERGNNRQDVLFADDDRGAYLEFLGRHCLLSVRICLFFVAGDAGAGLRRVRGPDDMSTSGAGPRRYRGHGGPTPRLGRVRGPGATLGAIANVRRGLKPAAQIVHRTIANRSSR